MRRQRQVTDAARVGPRFEQQRRPCAPADRRLDAARRIARRFDLGHQPVEAGLVTAARQAGVVALAGEAAGEADWKKKIEDGARAGAEAAAAVRS